MIYLAAPYTSKDSNIVEARVKEINRHVAALIRNGEFVFSPITHCHPLVDYGLPGDFDYWQRYNYHMLTRSYYMLVLQLEGWDISAGIAGEIDFCNRRGIAIRYRSPDARCD